jgi:hypothetical protein
VCEKRKRNRRSLHYAPPDFLLRLVAFAELMRLSLRKAAYVVVDDCRVVGNPGTLRSEAVTFFDFFHNFGGWKALESIG